MYTTNNVDLKDWCKGCVLWKMWCEYSLPMVNYICSSTSHCYQHHCCCFMYFTMWYFSPYSPPASHSGHMNVISDNCDQTGCGLEGNTSVGRKWETSSFLLTIHGTSLHALSKVQLLLLWSDACTPEDLCVFTGHICNRSAWWQPGSEVWTPDAWQNITGMSLFSHILYNLCSWNCIINCLVHVVTV
jgi:hypothetical protein